MSPQLLAACTGATLARAEVYAGFLSAGMAFDNITTPMRQAMFLANLGHESLRLARTTESLDYRATALISKFGRHRISIDDANKYGRIEGKQKANQEAIANCLYGGEWGKAKLGNTQPGDGWKFIGHGLIHNTGRANARAARERLRAKYPLLNVPDFEAHPELMAEAQWAALTACDYVSMRSLNDHADAGNFDGYVDVINLGKRTDKYGDAEGWSDRLELFGKAKVALRIA